MPSFPLTQTRRNTVLGAIGQAGLEAVEFVWDVELSEATVVASPSRSMGDASWTRVEPSGSVGSMSIKSGMPRSSFCWTRSSTLLRSTKPRGPQSLDVAAAGTVEAKV